MARQPKHEIILAKPTKKRLPDDKLQAQLQHLIERALASGRSSRWDAKMHYGEPVADFGSLTYNATLALTCTSARRTAEARARDLEQIVKVVNQAGRARKWSIATVNGTRPDFLPPAGSPAADRVVAQAELPAEWREAFGHIYERDAQIEIVASAVLAAINSNFQNRFHVCLYGDPAGGKTEIARTFKHLLGDSAVLEYDATATSQAGAIKDLAERDEIPPFLIVEEIEKADEASLRWLLGVLDHRGEIRKTNFRGTIQRDCRMFALCTVNNYDLFCSLMSGALASRFPQHVYCPRPGRSVLQRILEREIARSRGKRAWIKPALDYAEAHGINDPRKVTSIALCGCDDLLTGVYQQRLDECTRPIQTRE